MLAFLDNFALIPPPSGADFFFSMIFPNSTGAFPSSVEYSSTSQRFRCHAHPPRPQRPAHDHWLQRLRALLPLQRPGRRRRHRQLFRRGRGRIHL